MLTAYPLKIEVYRDWVSQIENNQEKLNTWETDFIASIADRLDKDKIPTERQAEILENIYAKHT